MVGRTKVNVMLTFCLASVILLLLCVVVRKMVFVSGAENFEIWTRHKAKVCCYLRPKI